MADEPTVGELNQKVNNLQEEQTRLKEEQQKLRESGAGGPEQKGQEQKKDGGQQQQAEQKPPEKPKKPIAQRTRRYIKRHPGRILLGAIALVLVIVGSALLWTYLSSYESTDDAQVDGHLNMISPRIRGTVVGVYV